MKLELWISLGALVLVGSVAGCVTDAETLFGSGNGNTGGSGGSGQGGGSNASSSSSGDVSSSSSSGGPGSSSSSSSGGPGSSSSSSSGGPGSSSSSASSSSSSSGSTGNVVFCADNACNAGDVCCFSFNDPTQDHCNADPNCGMGFAVLSCNGPSDCPGAICCATRANGTYTDISCQATCAGTGQYVVCEGDQSVCPAGLTCTQSQSLGTGYMTCR